MVQLGYHLRYQPSEISNLYYFEYEIIIEELQELLKQKNEAEKKQYDEQQANTPNYSKYQKGMSNIKQPRIPRIK